MRSSLAAWLIAGFLTGCARPSMPDNRAAPVTSRSSDAGAVVTRLELERVPQGGNLMAALEQLRPWFFTERAWTVVVMVNGSLLGDISVLRTIPVTDVCEVRLQRTTSEAGRSVIHGTASRGADLIAVTFQQGATTLCPRP